MGLDNDLTSKKKRGGRPRHGIVALSSAAVLVVYSAGYVRSADAAHRFDEQDAARARAVPLIRAATLTAPVVVPAARAGAARPAAVPAQPAAPTPEPGIESSAAPAPVLAPAPSAAAPLPEAAALASEGGQPVAPTPVAAPAMDTPAPVAVASAPVAAAAPAPAVPAPPAAPKYTDGTYAGWGTSRHGDIQAQVEIANGKIASARIISCLTRYSCSWIEALPGQVVSRQSANVDYVSGATQSSDAFYYAIVQALAKAH